MTMQDRIDVLTTQLAQVDAAMQSVQSEEASTVIIDGRTIIRTNIKALRATRNQIIIELNTLKAYLLDEDPPLFKGANI